MTLSVVLTAIVVLLSCASLGGGLYEALVVDPVWPHRPAVIQPRNGGMSRIRFWVPVHSVFELALVVAIIATWRHPDVRAALLVAVVSHLVMRAWSFADLIPKAAAFERADPATIDRADAQRWTRRSLLRLPLDVIACVASLVALVLAS